MQQAAWMVPVTDNRYVAANIMADGLFGCCDDPLGCICALLFPCCSHASTWDKYMAKQGNPGACCFKCCAVACSGNHTCVLAQDRYAMKTTLFYITPYNGSQGQCMECCTAWICQSCALAQQARAIDKWPGTFMGVGASGTPLFTPVPQMMQVVGMTAMVPQTQVVPIN